MKTKEELNQLKTEYVKLNEKLKELSNDELKQVIGGSMYIVDGQGEEHLVDKYNGVIGHSYTFRSDHYAFTGILLDSYEKKNWLFGTTRYHKVQVERGCLDEFQVGAIVDINGDKFKMYEH